MPKVLDLYRHAEKTSCGNHISAQGREHASQVGGEIHMSVNHVFHGTLPRTLETLTAMMTVNSAFDEAQFHQPLANLGSAKIFKWMITARLRRLVKNDGLSVMQAVKHCHESGLNFFKLIDDSADDIWAMFEAMEDGQYGVGVFHNPTIPLIAEKFGLQDAFDLESLDYLRFVCDEQGLITVLTSAQIKAGKSGVGAVAP